MRPVIAGNWKMHMGPSETRAFFDRFDPRAGPEAVSILVFPPAASLSVAQECLRGRVGVSLGVQNIHWEEKGAFTGETSAAMAADAGATHVLVGHSERRHVFGETNEETSRKVQRALDTGLVPVLCVGETLTERRDGRLEEVILGQLEAGAAPVADAGQATSFLVAYEPVWAIGTGETATPEDASEAHLILLRRLEELLGGERAAEVPILYGGSVKPDNAAELLAAPAVSGVLVGGASLDPASFAAIVDAA